MTNKVIKSWVEGPKFAGIPSFLRKLAFELDVDIKIDVDKHFIRETVYFKVEGAESKLRIFKDTFDKSLSEHQSR